MVQDFGGLSACGGKFWRKSWASESKTSQKSWASESKTLGLGVQNLTKILGLGIESLGRRSEHSWTSESKGLGWDGSGVVCICKGLAALGRRFLGGHSAAVWRTTSFIIWCSFWSADPWGRLLGSSRHQVLRKINPTANKDAPSPHPLQSNVRTVVGF